MDAKILLDTLSEQNLLARAALVVAIIIAALLVWLIVVIAVRRAANRLSRAMEDETPAVRRRQQRALTALGLTANLAKWVIVVGCAMVVVVAVGLGPKLAPLLAGAGIVGVAVGFGSQALVRDVISGLFLLLEGQYAVGDYVTTAGLSGRVVSIGLRVTALQGNDGQVHYLPNGGISVVTVRDEPWLAMIVDTPVAPEKAEDGAKAALPVEKDLAEQYPEWLRLGDPPSVVGGGTHALVRVPIEVHLGSEWLVNDELTARLKAAFVAQGVMAAEDRPPKPYNAMARPPYALEGVIVGEELAE
jgi:small-conductance mechanosensitive channel